MTQTRGYDYVMDADTLIRAHRHHYAFDLCPGFWESLLHFHELDRVVSIDRVGDELRHEQDVLANWVNDIASSSFFASTDDEAVLKPFAEVMIWVDEQDQFKPEAREEFAAAADGWLVAYAKAYGSILITHEVLAPDAQKRVPIPNICRAFDVTYKDTFSMLKGLSVRFSWDR